MRNAGLKRIASAGLKPLVFGLLLLPALLPLFQGDALPCTHDNIFHSYRIVAMRDMLRHGWLFSRWVPNLALGYGYPFFNYREPLPYLVGEGLYALGLPVPLVLGLLYAGSLVGAALGAYALARDLFGARAGWVAGVAYGLSPYLLMHALRRGNMPESVGLALVPWLFVTTRRVILHKKRSDVAATALLLVALFLSHNISSL
ncbi:MAG: 6-pyruvoyl-tetrahydropterin synthase-related protein, partial [Anaerolineae bacterium]